MTAEEKFNEEVNKPMSPSEFIEAIEALARVTLKLVDKTKLYLANNGVPKKTKKQEINKKLKTVLNIASRLPGKKFKNSDIADCLMLSRGGAYGRIQSLIKLGMVKVISKANLPTESAEYVVVDQGVKNDGNGFASDDAQNGTARAEV